MQPILGQLAELPNYGLGIRVNLVLKFSRASGRHQNQGYKTKVAPKVCGVRGISMMKHKQERVCHSPLDHEREEFPA